MTTRGGEGGLLRARREKTARVRSSLLRGGRRLTLRLASDRMGRWDSALCQHFCRHRHTATTTTALCKSEAFAPITCVSICYFAGQFNSSQMVGPESAQRLKGVVFLSLQAPIRIKGEAQSVRTGMQDPNAPDVLPYAKVEGSGTEGGMTTVGYFN